MPITQLAQQIPPKWRGALYVLALVLGLASAIVPPMAVGLGWITEATRATWEQMLTEAATVVGSLAAGTALVNVRAKRAAPPPVDHDPPTTPIPVVTAPAYTFPRAA